MDTLRSFFSRFIYKSKRGSLNTHDPNVIHTDEHGEIEMYSLGYPRLAALQSSDPVFAIFRRFGTLRARCLLLAQEELCTLETKLNLLDRAERTQLFLSSRVHDGNAERRSLIEEIKPKLRTYEEDLMRFLKLSEAAVPRKNSTQSFFRWMDYFKPLIEDETEFMKNPADFVTVRTDLENGFLESVVERLARKTGFGVKEQLHKSSDQYLHFFSAERLGLVTRFVLTALVSSFLLVPSMLLYIIPNKTFRLVSIPVFTLLFAFVLAIFTRAKRHEIFASTSAFCAVLVVFVSNINTPSG